MVTKYGMSDKLGAINYSAENGEVFLGRDFNRHSDLSEKTVSEIDAEVKSIIDNAYKTAEYILNNNLDKLHIVANILMEKEKIDGEEFAKNL